MKISTNIVLIIVVASMASATSAQLPSSTNDSQSNPNIVQVNQFIDELRDAHRIMEKGNVEERLLAQQKFLKNFDSLAKLKSLVRDSKNLTFLQRKLLEIAYDRQMRPNFYLDIENRYAFPSGNYTRSGVNPPIKKISDSSSESRLAWEYLLLRPHIVGARDNYHSYASTYLSIIGNPESAYVALESFDVNPNQQNRMECIELLLVFPSIENAKRLTSSINSEYKLNSKNYITSFFISIIQQDSFRFSPKGQQWRDIFSIIGNDAEKQQDKKASGYVIQEAIKAFNKPPGS